MHAEKWRVRVFTVRIAWPSNSLLECLVFGARAGTNAAIFAESESPDHPPDYTCR